MQRYFAVKKENNSIYLCEDDYFHIKKVMRMNNLDFIEVVYNNKLYKCQIKDLVNNVIEIFEEIEFVHDKLPHIILLIPTLKEQKLDLILQKGTEIGIKEFIIVPYERSMIKYDSKKEAKKIDRWNKIVKEASEQSHRVELPNVEIKNDFGFLKNMEALKLICSTTEKNNYIKTALKSNNRCDKIVLAIGPEGGISPMEEEFFESIGFKKVTLGSQIMRVETVPIFLASVIRYEYME